MSKFVNQRVNPESFLLISQVGVMNSLGRVYPNHILFSLINGNTSLYVIAFLFAIIKNFLLYSISNLTNALKSENGGFVTITSASFKSSKHSGESKLPLPFKISILSCSLIYRSAVSLVSSPYSSIMVFISSSRTIALYGLPWYSSSD